jgi:peptide chain release factor 1
MAEPCMEKGSVIFFADNRIMFLEKLKTLNNQFKEIEKQLGESSIISNQEKYKELTKQYFYLRSITEKYVQYSKLLNDIKDAEDLKKSGDSELREMAFVEYDDLISKKEKFESEIKVLLMPPDLNENKNIIIEIRAGTGGAEAALFVGDLYRMYTRFAD